MKLTAAEQALAEAAMAVDQAVATAAADTARAKQDMVDAIAAAKAEAESHKIEVKTEADLRVIRAEAKAEAIKAGMIDMDGLKLIDTSAVTIGEDGEVKIPDGFFKAAKETKPWLFGAVSSSVQQLRFADCCQIIDAFGPVRCSVPFHLTPVNYSSIFSA